MLLHGGGGHNSLNMLILLCRANGDNKHCRKLLQRALNSVTDWPESIVEAYVNFEREEGKKGLNIQFSLSIKDNVTQWF